MRAIVASPEGAVFKDLESPKAGPGFVVVKVKAAALNRADLMMLTGESHGFAGGVGLPLGLEWAGEVVEVGKGVDNLAVGDRVMAAGPGAFSEYVAAHAKWVWRIPDPIPDERAAALPVSLQTMHDALAANGQLATGQSVLIQGASSAMGLMGLQIAKHLGAGLVIGTSTTPERLHRLADFGAGLAVNTRDTGWVKQVHQATRMKGVDLTVDLLAGPLFNDTLQATKIGGRIVNVGRMAGNRVEVDLEQHSMRRTQYIGVTFRTRNPAEITEVIARASAALLPALAEGTLKMPVDHVFRFQEFPAAFERMAQNRHFGKIVLALD